MRQSRAAVLVTALEVKRLQIAAHFPRLFQLDMMNPLSMR
jgi:hypothetical protein